MTGITAAMMAAAGSGGFVGTQVARPASTLVQGGWLPYYGSGGTAPPGDLHTPLADVVADEYGRYIYSDSGIGDACVLGLEPLIDPQVSSGHVVLARYTSPFGSTGVAVAVLQGETVIATRTFAASTNQSFANRTYTLTAAEADEITDYGNLRLRITVTAASSRSSLVTQAHLTVTS